jgi:hypothetical protein
MLGGGIQLTNFWGRKVMRFNFSYAQDVSQTQMAAFEMAGKIWASYLTDNVTINDLGFAQPLLNFQNTLFSILDQQQISQGLEFGTELTKSNVVLGSNKSQTSSTSDSSQLLGDSFTPWWLGDSSSLWAVR